jgi:hypothetical protein
MPPLLAFLLPLAIDLAPLEQRAKSSVERGDFDAAASAWEALAAAAPPRSPRAAEALVEAALLHLGLGEPAQAEADFERFQRAFAAAPPALLARLVLAFARRDLDAEAWADAHARLRRHQPRLDGAASIEARIELHALLARALRALARPAEAAREQGLVITLARLPAARALAAPAREALAEVRFALAEEKRLAAEQITLPPYRGPNERAPILAYYRTTVEPWLIRRRYAVELAENAYDRVLGIDRKPPPPPPPPPPPGSLLGGDPNVIGVPFAPEGLGLEGVSADAAFPPSPRLAIAAAARVGGMWTALRSAQLAVPLAPPAPLPPEVEAAFATISCGVYDDIPRESAKRAFAFGLRLAQEHRIWSDDAAACERWLERNARYEYPPHEALWSEALRPSPPSLPAPALR